MTDVSSSMTGVMSVCLSSSYAAVSPAGPAPMMTAVFFISGYDLKTRNLLARKFQKNTMTVDMTLLSM